MDATEHEIDVVTTLGRHSPDDVYTPRCSCGWSGKARKAGVNPVNTWNKAWAEADAHVAAAVALAPSDGRST